MRLLLRLLCLLGNHDWTCKANQEIRARMGESFPEYAAMYCSRCGTESAASKKWRTQFLDGRSE